MRRISKMTLRLLNYAKNADVLASLLRLREQVAL